MPLWATPFLVGAALSAVIVAGLLLQRASTIRAGAVTMSRAVLRGQAAEQMMPFVDGFPFDPNDARFLGHPLDYVIFDGLGGDGDVSVVFVEVKTGGARLSAREKRVRQAIEAGRVRFEIVRL